MAKTPRKRRSKSELKYKKNPLPLAAWFAAGGLKFISASLIYGTVVVGTGLAIYSYATTEDHGPSPSAAKDVAQKMLDYASDGGTDPDHVLANMSLTLTPTNLLLAYAQIAFYAARAGVRSKEAAFLQISQEYLDKLGAWSKPAGNDNTAVIAQTLQDAANKMQAVPNAYLAQKDINKIASMADPSLVQAEMNEQEKYKVDPYEAWRNTAADTMTPFSLAAGLWTGKVPAGWDPKTFRMIQFGIYGTIGLALFSTVKGYLPKFPRRQENQT